MKNLFKLAAITAILIIATALPARAQVTAQGITAAFTNNPTVITNGLTTFAGTTNRQVDLGLPGRGIGFQFSFLATNAGQVTLYFVLSGDGTNYNSTTIGPFVWGHTAIVDTWVNRSTNIPASLLDNHTKIKVLFASNSCDYVLITNASFLKAN